MDLMAAFRRALLGLILLSPGILPAADAGSLEGAWMGTLEAGALKLRLALHIQPSPDGALSATLDSIDQGAMGIPVTRITRKDQTISFEIKRIQAAFEGTLNADSSRIEGSFHQAGVDLPLVFHHTDKAPELIRPQNPRRPYPYAEEEVSYENKAAGVRIAGTLTLPRSSGPHPAVLLITGSGPQDRNETIAGHQPFLVLADHLTRRGIAVLRADDRGVGRSTGRFDTATMQDFAADARAGVEYLRTRSEIDSRRIGVLGHSEGAEIAPLLASQDPAIAFVVMLAGPGVTGEKILYEQSYLINKAMGMPEEMARKLGTVDEVIFDVVKREPDDAVARKKIQAAVEGLRSSFPRSEQQAFNRILDQIGQKARFATSPWFRFFLTYDPAAALRKVQAPVLAVSGELDLQVPPAENLPAIAAALKAGGNKDYTIVKLPSLNHLLQTARTGSPLEYTGIDETIAPSALEKISQWIVAHTAK
ncbi:MAG TPA: alpha/beta fold hydrolase [Bryobacteraceae bacterium]|nr:alpha/beta fold hydrolase [Bryobacteraceae bacterium]